MTDRDDLYAAILDRPDDDTPRLVLADWYDDHGDAARAEFVRVQVELARTEDCGHAARGTWHLDGSCRECPKLYPLRERERVLWFGHIREWFGDTALWLPTDNYERGSPHATGLVVRRGFVDEARLPLAAFVGDECDCSDAIQGWGCPTCQNTGRVPGIARELFAAHPITRVVLTDVEPWTTGAANVTDGDPEHGWSWWRASAWPPGRTADDRGNLPDDLFDMMVRMYPDRVLLDGAPPTNQHIGFPSEAAALDALSAACVAYGRSLAAKPAPA